MDARTDARFISLTLACILGVFICFLSAHAAVGADLAKQIDKDLRAVERKIVTAPSEAETELEAVKNLFSQLQQESPNHPKLSAFAQKIDKLDSKLAKRLGRDVKPVSGSSGQTGSAAKPPAKEIVKKEKDTASENVEKLPGGVTSRLKNMNSEMDKAEKSLANGSGSASDRATRAEQYLKRAYGYKDEIEKKYTGQYSEDHADVATAYDRLDDLAATVKSTGQEAAAAEEAARQAEQTQQAKEAAAAKAAADEKEAREQEAAASAQQVEEVCQSWKKRLDVYAEGDKAMYRCVGGSDDEMPQCKTWNDEAVALLEKYDQSPVAAEPCGAIRSTLSDVRRYLENFAPVYERYAKKMEAAQANLGEFLFSTTPIDPKNPTNLGTTFKAGDFIYGLIRTQKPWAEIYQNRNSANVMVNVKIDGQKIHAQFVNLKKPELLNQQYLIFEIAPNPGKMTAYGNPDVEYGKSTATMRQGPNELTFHLGQLGPGSHTMEFEIQYYGTIWAAGSLTIQGDDFSSYAELHKKIATGVAKSVILPPAQMVNKKLAAEMEDLLKNAGWTKVYRLNIVDKDWWIDRVSGGNSPVKSRHIAAAVITRGDDGNYFYKVCTFHQDKLITGAFSELYLSHQGDPVPIPKENIDK